MHTNAQRASDTDAVTRRQAVAEVIGAAAIASQAELAQRLKARGVHVTQATLSRDLKALGIGKVPTEGGGYAYVLPAPVNEVVNRPRQELGVVAFVQTAKVVGNLVVIRTPPGNAHGVGRAVDVMRWEEIEGTIPGDDTILVVTRSAARARKFRSRLEAMVGRTLG